jgi:4-hydroxybenzoate polyprenyltransferase
MMFGDGRLRYLFKVSRPRFWLYLAGPVAVGVVYAARAVDGLFTPATLALFAYFLLPANVLLYGVNDVFDADVDEDNPKKEKREVRYGGDALVPAAVGLCVLLAFVPVALTPPLAWPWVAGFLALGVAYSAPPLRLKTRPPLDSVSNGLYVLPGAGAYAAVAGAQPPLLAVAGGWIWSMAMHTFSAIPDIEPDRAAGIETTATRLGERLTYVYCGAAWTLAAVAFGLLDVRLGLLLGLYPLAVALVATSSIAVSRAYWWYPAVNTVVGALLTMGGLWGLVHG